ncbi:peptide ABC transporter substrate-binding protein [Pseudomonas syringae KCTC 12500]|uniref:ABC transporter substrate-binding protein n=1 Tax=Pseudomonas syringae TaxID=317 RepID=UPI000418E8F3|nr:ABC transporter substrate-binding protein [Pseudomonas syringae]KMY00800.1 peptide ABC transporter substrate-binding protein [Pseudomonas syringae KCTC 12500]POR86730.1 ABC transporter substrate-binding protein [Pseudomonas syringae pv. syringae]
MKLLSLRASIAIALLSAAATVSAKPLVVCTEASPEGFDIVQYTTAVTADASAETILERLVAFTPGTTDTVPGLAESWEISPDGLTYTFKLRKGVKFHTTDYFKPTREMNADDVVWSFKRQLDPKHPWHALSLVGYPYFESMGFQDLLKDVEKVDDSTVKLTLTHPESPFLRDLAMPFTSIYSAEYADQLLKSNKTAELNSKPIGTGPFILTRYAKDAQVRYKANPNYWKGKVPSEALIFAITLDNNTRLQKLKANECQVALYPKPDDIANIKADPNLKIAEMESMMTSYLAMNTSHKYLSDVRVRQAINLAFDKKSYIRALFGEGKATEGVGPYPPTMMGYDTDSKSPAYDPDKARALLKEAGVPEGQVFTLFARNGGAVTNPNPMVGAQMLQSDMAKVGIKIDIRIMEWGEMLKRAKKGEHDMVFAGWAGDNGDPDNFLTPNLSCDAAKNGENYARWCNKAFEDAITQARKITEPEKRAALYKQAQQVFNHEQPWISLAYPKLFVAMRKDVEGFQISPLTNNNFTTTRVK